MKKNIVVWVLTILLFSSLSVSVQATIISLKAKSAGYDVRDYSFPGTAQLWVDSKNYSLNGRGFNLVVIDRYTGTTRIMVMGYRLTWFNRNKKKASYKPSIY